MAIKSISVLGAGTMGHGIAQVAAMADFRVVMRDISADLVSKGLGKIRQNLDKGVEKGKLDAEARQKALANITITTNLEQAVRPAEMIIEAAPESLELKREIFGELNRLAHPGAILATNTSSISIAEIAVATNRPPFVVV